MKIKDKVLIVEDEKSISNFISMILQANGFDTIVVRTGEEALTMISSHCPDLILLDLGLPDMEGMEVLKSVRKWSNLPVVVVSARNHEHDKVEALDYGADDYLVKPFDVVELVARVEVVLRRYNKTETILTAGDVVVDEDARKVTKAGRPIVLTNKEYGLLVLFIRNKNIALFRENLYEKVWGDEYLADSRTLDLHVQRLRKKMGWEKNLVAVYKVGYRLEI